jgi:hypothetical protein
VLPPPMPALALVPPPRRRLGKNPSTRPGCVPPLSRTPRAAPRLLGRGRGLGRALALPPSLLPSLLSFIQNAKTLFSHLVVAVVVVLVLVLLGVIRDQGVLPRLAALQLRPHDHGVLGCVGMEDGGAKFFLGGRGRARGGGPVVGGEESEGRSPVALFSPLPSAGFCPRRLLGSARAVLSARAGRQRAGRLRFVLGGLARGESVCAGAQRRGAPRVPPPLQRGVAAASPDAAAAAAAPGPVGGFVVPVRAPSRHHTRSRNSHPSPTTRRARARAPHLTRGPHQPSRRQQKRGRAASLRPRRAARAVLSVADRPPPRAGGQAAATAESPAAATPPSHLLDWTCVCVCVCARVCTRRTRRRTRARTRLVGAYALFLGGRVGRRQRRATSARGARGGARDTKSSSRAARTTQTHTDTPHLLTRHITAAAAPVPIHPSIESAARLANASHP